MLGAVVLIALLLLSTAYGTTAIPAPDVVHAVLLGLGLTEGEAAPVHRIVFELRLPRALFAAVIGAGLGIVGVVLQTTTRNDLADPFLFGLSSGAAAGAVFVITVTGDILGFWTLPVAAFTGGIIASAIVLSLVHSLRTSAPEKLILAGLAVSFLFAAITNYLIFAGDSRAAHSVIFWMLGGLGLAQWGHLIYPLVILLVCGAWLMLRAADLNAMTIGDETASTLGIPVARFRLYVFVVSALITGVMVAFSGMIEIGRAHV